MFNPVIAAKGRTNVELREQFTLASGVSQSMTPFKSRAQSGAGLPSPGSSVSGQGQRQSISGPITKVRKQVFMILFDICKVIMA